MRSVLDTQLESLRNQIGEMSSLCEVALVNAMRALSENDLELAENIIKYDSHINNMEKEIQNLCYSLLVRQQPVASDFRFLSASLKIVTDLERIGDYATDISEIIMEYPRDTFFIYEKDLISMAKHCIKMLQMSTESLMNMNVSLAHDVIAYDDNVDNALSELKVKILDVMMKENQNNETILDTFMIAKYFERVGDRCVNVATSVLYFETGQ